MDWIYVALMAALGFAYGVIWKLQGNRFSRIEKKLIDEEAIRLIAATEMRDDLEKIGVASDAHCELCKERLMVVVKESKKNMIDTFNEGIKVEREFRVGIMREDVANLTKLSEKFDILALKVRAVITAQDIYHAKKQ